MYRIREVDGEDEHEALTELHRATFTDGERVADFTSGYWWVATHNDTPVAFIGVVESPRARQVGYFNRVGVLPDHRGKRLQRRLMRAMEQKAKKIGWKKIITDTRHNPSSANNIIAAGYKMFSPIDAWGHIDACYWTKDL